MTCPAATPTGEPRVDAALARLATLDAAADRGAAADPTAADPTAADPTAAPTAAVADRAIDSLGHHVAVYEEVHRLLQDALADLDES